MMIYASPCVGGIPSADIAVPEHERELRFYSRVLGTGAEPLWREDLMNSRGTPIIGLGERTAEYAELPLQWMPHIQVADVAASARRAVDLGGRELMHGKDDAGASQWAVLLDSNGAAFGIIPVVPAEAIPPAERGSSDSQPPAGHIAGAELTVPDAAATSEFYRQVIGWSAGDVVVQDADGRRDDHRLLAADGRPAACVRQARGASPELPPVWLIHLPVGDLAESVRRVAEEGGQIVTAPPGSAGGRVPRRACSGEPPPPREPRCAVRRCGPSAPGRRRSETPDAPR